MKRRAVFLDRDGVLVRNELRAGKPYAPRTLAEFELLPDALGATTALRQAGFVLVVVTNQPDVADGLVDRATVEAMHGRLLRELPIDAIKVCYHARSENCDCRKPRPGMLLQAARELDIDLAASFMVGDRWRDIVAGQAQGCYTVFIDRGYKERRPEDPDVIVSSLAEAVGAILNDP